MNVDDDDYIMIFKHIYLYKKNTDNTIQIIILVILSHPTTI